MALKPTNFPNGIKAPIVAADGSAVTALTDSTGGTASDTLAAISNTLTGVDGTASNAAPLAGVNTQLGILRNAIASLAAKVNDLTGT
jgi:hypothetical protein